mmetsp:Transcript_16535/g.19116  ORF Transcript_16535/g.19116 Transcript_16535/m.19116 type:complete len:343 (+) Transcript_16535:1522-2550(+)
MQHDDDKFSSLEEVAEFLLERARELKQQVFSAHRLVTSHAKTKHAFKQLKAEYISKLDERYSCFIYKDSRKSEYQEIREQLQTVEFKPLPGEQTSQYSPESIPILFECPNQAVRVDVEDSEPDYSLSSSWTKGYHVFILLHGLGSSHANMIKIVNHIALVCENAEFVLPRGVNGDKSGQSLRASGKIIANEIIEYLDLHYNDEDIARISFISHSLGGVIARAVIPRLRKYHSKFYTFCSLATPHLGILTDNPLLKLGLWVFNLLKNSRSITELRLEDEADIEDSCLFELSEQRCFEYFEHVYLFSADSDYFSPSYSTRIQVGEEDLPNKETLYKMARNMFSN